MMKNTRHLMLTIFSLVLTLALFAGSPATAFADNTDTENQTAMSDTIALNPGFYCLHPHKKTPMPADPILMKAIPSTEYTGYPTDTMDKVAAAVILRGDYYRETDITIEDGDLQHVIWAIVCQCETTMGGTNIHLNGRENAKAYYEYVMANYSNVVGKYTMTIWQSTIDEYQDILEAKMVEKHSVPSVEKKVKDRNDSESPNFDPVGWQDSADHDIGDSIPFQITASLRDMTGFRAYYLEFVDHMTHLTLDRSSLKVTIDGVDKTDGFEVTWSAETKDLNIKCEDVLKLGATNDSKVVVTYNATLDADAAIGGVTGNPNEVYLIYSRATGTADRGISPTDKVIVFTYQATFNKVDDAGVPLGGAAFELFKWVADSSEAGGHYASLGVLGAVKNADDTYTPNQTYEGTAFQWKGLDDGKYKLEEVVTPKGYNTMEPLEFTVSALHDHLSEDPKLRYLDSDYAFTNSTPYNWDHMDESNVDENGFPIMKEEGHFMYDGTMKSDIMNQAGAVLPETGGIGTAPIYLAGAVMMFAAMALLRKKRRA